jgi:RNase P/RNase MRP subunit p29
MALAASAAARGVFNPQQPVLAGTVNSTPNGYPTAPNGNPAAYSLPLQYSPGPSPSPAPPVNRAVVAPGSPIQAGTVWPSSFPPPPPGRVVARPGSCIGMVQSGSCNTTCDPCNSSWGAGQAASVRDYLAGSLNAPCAPPPALPVSRTLPIISEEMIGRKVDIVEHQRVVRGLEHRIVQLETQLVAAQQPNPEVPLLHSRIATLESQLSQLTGVQATLEGMRADARYLDAENRQLEAVVRELEARLRTQECAYSELTERATRLANEGRQLDAELQRVLRDQDLALQERDQFARKLGGVEQDRLQGAAGIRAAEARLQGRVSQLETELGQLVATLRLRDAEIKDLTHQIRMQPQDVSSLDFSRLKQDNIALIREVERTSEEIHILEAEVARLRGDLAECRGGSKPVAAQGHRPILGVEIKMLDDAAGRPDSVVVVHMVTPGGPSDRAGLRPGDVLKEWDGLLLDSKAKFQRLVDQTQPGTRIILTVVRGTSVVDVPVTMGSAPAGFSHHHRVVHSANQVTNVIQDRNGAAASRVSTRGGY